METFFEDMNAFFTFVFTQMSNFVEKFLLGTVLGKIILGGLLFYLVIYVVLLIIEKAKK